MPWIYELRALADDSGQQMTFIDNTGAPMDFINLAGPNEAFTKRLAACWNVCVGIPTEVVEAGVVVVPVEELRKRLPALIRATAEMVLLERRKLANDQVDEELKDLSALSQTTAKMESKLGGFIEWLSRLQQNGGEGR